MAEARDRPWRTHPQQARPRPPQTVPRKRNADEQEDAWVAGEDRFVLKQAKKKAEIRVREGRPRPIDWLAITLRFAGTSRNDLDEDVDDSDLDIVDPEGVFDSLDIKQLDELHHEIKTFIRLELDDKNIEYWETMKIICEDRRQKLQGQGSSGRGIQTVATDVDKLFAPKSLEELQALETQIRTKLDSDADIDVDYWEHLLRSLLSWKARAKLRQVCQSILNNKMDSIRAREAEKARELVAQLSNPSLAISADTQTPAGEVLNPDPLLKISPEDRQLERKVQQTYLNDIVDSRKKILKLGYVPPKSRPDRGFQSDTALATAKSSANPQGTSQAADALYEREVARGVGDGEEVFTGEENVESRNTHLWSNQYKPRKPRYFNRVQMGYEWNKYNQTHYDHENPPPKVVQGYKFNIFYPDLVDKAKAPTYKIERENGRRRGEASSGPGHEDSCIIRFIAGPPYEDIAFRIVDREWDYSAKRERGFKSSFERGILQLHFQFKKIFYRK